MRVQTYTNRDLYADNTTTYDVSVRPWGSMPISRLKDLGFKDADYNGYDNVSFTYTTDEEPSKAYRRLRNIIERDYEIGSIVMFEEQIIKNSRKSIKSENKYGADVDRIYEKQLNRIKKLRTKGYSDDEIDDDEIVRQTKEDMRNVGKIKSSRRPVKSGYEGDDAEAEELALYIKNTSELYHGITHSVIENLKKKARKGVYDKERAVDAWMYVADAGAKMYDKELGSGRGSMTLFTKDERRKAAEELARYYEENVLEGLDNVQSAFKPIKSAVDGGWEVDSSDVPEALDLFVEYYGEEEALEAIAKAMSSDTLDENIEWIARHWGFAEELEGYDDSWDKYEYAKEVMGESQLFNELTSAAGYDELAEDLAYIFRMYDFREWDKYDDDDEDDDEEYEDLESENPELYKQLEDVKNRKVDWGEVAKNMYRNKGWSEEDIDKIFRRISSGKRTVDHKKPSREEIEKALDKKLAQQKVKFATDMYDDTVDYILSFWDEEDYIPKDADDAVSQWYNDTKKHFPQDLKKIASAAYRHWIRSKLIKSSRRIR